VGIYFVTHAPSDVPAEVLSQLGNRVQHALRAFTPDDLATVRATAQTFPATDYYDVSTELTSLGIGEALVTGLSPKGIPMPTVHTMLRPPASLMAQLDPSAFTATVAASPLVQEYAADQDPDSAKEMLAARMASVEAAAQAASASAAAAQDRQAPAGGGGRMRPTTPPESGIDWGDVAKEGARIARSGAFNTILRSVLGVMAGGSRRR
jgi:hypothetical protein